MVSLVFASTYNGILFNRSRGREEYISRVFGETVTVYFSCLSVERHYLYAIT